MTTVNPLETILKWAKEAEEDLLTGEGRPARTNVSMIVAQLEEMIEAGWCLRLTEEREAAGDALWSQSAAEAMQRLLDAHNALDREKLGRALNGIRILLDLTPDGVKNGNN